ncbi:helix-turn-helix domain-containing protein [Bradyrhizobium sp. HKCCYLS1011]|uniref:AraC family transcriptional regulator n=1 Tax=Bradyrhizobium sp. HKCCYLS1011 TaxID=3420733 RepID=UPI003EBE6F42
MLTDMQAAGSWSSYQAIQCDPGSSQEARALPCEREWRQPEQGFDAAPEDITISRWIYAQAAVRHEEAVTPPDRYFISIALKTTRLKLSRGNRTIFDGIMPAGSLYVGAPSRQLSVQFLAPCDFLHFSLPIDRFSPPQIGSRLWSGDDLNDLILLRDPFAEQLAKALTEPGSSVDQEFAQCVGRTLAMHISRHEPPRTKVNALPKWRLRRVEAYVKTHYDSCIRLSDLAKVAGLSRMHFAAQFRAATGYRPREYLLHQRIEYAKTLLSNSETSLAEIALAVGFCTQAHFSTVFKRITGDTPARWRCTCRNELPPLLLLDNDRASACKTLPGVAPANRRESCEMRNNLGS